MLASLCVFPIVGLKFDCCHSAALNAQLQEQRRTVDFDTFDIHVHEQGRRSAKFKLRHAASLDSSAATLEHVLRPQPAS